MSVARQHFLLPYYNNETRLLRVTKSKGYPPPPRGGGKPEEKTRADINVRDPGGGRTKPPRSTRLGASAAAKPRLGKAPPRRDDTWRRCAWEWGWRDILPHCWRWSDN